MCSDLQKEKEQGKNPGIMLPQNSHQEWEWNLHGGHGTDVPINGYICSVFSQYYSGDTCSVLGTI